MLLLEPSACSEKNRFAAGSTGAAGHSVSHVPKQDAKVCDDNPIYQQIDHSKLVPLLVKTIQELEARITTLEG